MRTARWMSFPSLALALWLAPAPSRAAVEPADGTVVDKTTLAILGDLPIPGLSMQRDLPTDRDVNVLVTAGSSFVSAVALARPSVPPQRVGEVLDAAMIAAGHRSKTVWYASEEGYSAASAHGESSRIGRRRHAQALDLRGLAAAFESQGFAPRILLRVPRHARVTGAGPVARTTRNYAWYDATPPASAPVRVEAALTPGGAALAWAILLLPLLSVVALAAGVLIVRRRSLPMAVRERAVRWLSWRFTIGVMGVSVLANLFYASSDAARPVADLWLGSVSAANALPAFGSILVYFILVGGAGSVLEERYFPSEPPAPEPTPAAKAIRRRMAGWSLAAALPFLAVYAFTLYGMRHSDPRRETVQVASFLLTMFAPELVQARFRKALAAVESEEAPALADEARRAGPLGAEIRSAEVDDSPMGKQAIGVAVRKGRLVLSRRAVDDLDEAERAFLVAHAMASPNLLLRFLLAGLPLALLACAWSGWILYHRPHWGLSPAWMVVLMMGPMVPAVFAAAKLGGWFYAKGLCEADRKALAATRDLPAAERAITKSMDPGSGNLERLARRRLAALRASAATLGLGH